MTRPSAKAQESPYQAGIFVLVRIGKANNTNWREWRYDASING